MPKTEMPPFREFAWVQDKFGVSPTRITRINQYLKIPYGTL